MSRELKATKTTVSIMTYILISIFTLSITLASGSFVVVNYFVQDAETQQIKKELAHYQELVREDNSNLENRIALAYRFYLLEDYASAIKHLEYVLEVDKEHFDAHLNLGYTYHALERHNEALKYFKTVTDLAPEDYRGWLNLGITLRELKLYQQAFLAFEEARKFNRGSVEVIYHYGHALEKSGDRKKAQEYFEHALRYDPNNKEIKEALERIRGG